VRVAGVDSGALFVFGVAALAACGVGATGSGFDCAVGGGEWESNTAAIITPTTPATIPNFASFVIGLPSARTFPSTIPDNSGSGRLTSSYLRETLVRQAWRAAHRAPAAPTV
jgi:hypothetical protein